MIGAAAADAAATCGGLAPTVDIASGDTATAGDDVILGTPSADEIRGLGGDDIICALGGDDVVYGGPGDDTVYGQAGDDQFFGGPGDDQLRGQGGDDQISGGAGADTIRGGPGDDELLGQTGDDRLFGDVGSDVLRGQGGNDLLYGGADDDQLTGGDGNDVLDGGPGVDTCDGEDLMNCLDTEAPEWIDPSIAISVNTRYGFQVKWCCLPGVSDVEFTEVEIERASDGQPNYEFVLPASLTPFEITVGSFTDFSGPPPYNPYVLDVGESYIVSVTAVDGSGNESVPLVTTVVVPDWDDPVAGAVLSEDVAAAAGAPLDGRADVVPGSTNRGGSESAAGESGGSVNGFDGYPVDNSERGILYYNEDRRPYFRFDKSANCMTVWNPTNDMLFNSEELETARRVARFADSRLRVCRVVRGIEENDDPATFRLTGVQLASYQDANYHGTDFGISVVSTDGDVYEGCDFSRLVSADEILCDYRVAADTYVLEYNHGQPVLEKIVDWFESEDGGYTTNVAKCGIVGLQVFFTVGSFFSGNNIPMVPANGGDPCIAAAAGTVDAAVDCLTPKEDALAAAPLCPYLQVGG